MNTNWPSAQEEYDMIWKSEETRGMHTSDIDYKYIPMKELDYIQTKVVSGLPTIDDLSRKPFSRKEINTTNEEQP